MIRYPVEKIDVDEPPGTAGNNDVDRRHHNSHNEVKSAPSAARIWSTFTGASQHPNTALEKKAAASNGQASWEVSITNSHRSFGGAKNDEDTEKDGKESRDDLKKSIFDGISRVETLQRAREKRADAHVRSAFWDEVNIRNTRKKEEKKERKKKRKKERKNGRRAVPLTTNRHRASGGNERPTSR